MNQKCEYELRVVRDEDPGNPRTDYDNFGTMVCFHTQYSLGDERHPFKTGPTLGSWAELRDAIIDDCAGATPKECVILPIYMIDHSGLSVSTEPFGCPWDSGQIGYIYASGPTICENWLIKDGVIPAETLVHAEDLLRGEVATYDQYLRGDVWGYQVVKKWTCGECLHKHEEVVDSCWGFYGEDDCRSEGQAALEHIREHGEAE